MKKNNQNIYTLLHAQEVLYFMLVCKNVNQINNIISFNRHLNQQLNYFSNFLINAIQTCKRLLSWLQNVISLGFIKEEVPSPLSCNNN